MTVRSTAGSVINDVGAARRYKRNDASLEQGGFVMSKMKRRQFLKAMGWSGAGMALAACDRPSFVTHREGRNKVVSYFVPEEYVIPGVGVWYASTCQQCPSGCGIQGRVREGRVLKLEGNPESPLNQGRLCAMGQSSLQTHYNPDRVTRPRVRRGGQWVDIGWDEALAVLREKIGPDSGLQGERFAWVTDTVSGHQAVLIDAFLESVGSPRHYVHETIGNPVWRAVCKDMLGDENPRLRYEKASLILSFGADFLGSWGAPVPNSVRYAEFRTAPRGMLIAAEPKMTLTGANADLWVPVTPGTEGVLALGIANVLATKHRRDISALPGDVQAQIRDHEVRKVAEITGTSGDHIVRIADQLNERSPSLVLAGASAEGHPHGYGSVAAAMMLNILLGNVGRTIESGEGFPFPQLATRTGSSKGLLEFTEALSDGQLDVVFFKGGNNPVFTAPGALRLREKLNSMPGAPFKVAFTQFEDETSLEADLILPLHSSLEDWGTHVSTPQPERMFISMQQPLMEPLYPDTRGFGDLLITMLNMRGVEDYADFENYYGYLRHAFANLPSVLKEDAPSDEAFWRLALQKGQLEVGSVAPPQLSVKAVSFKVEVPERNDSQPYFLLPFANTSKWDGRHANIPWLQELPDPISKVVWDSWAEIHPVTARNLGVQNGDVIGISSDHGTIEVKVYIYKGMHPNAIGVPMGQGHEAYGRYAKGRGVNPLRIVSIEKDEKTGEIAHHSTRIAVTKVRSRSKGDPLVVMGGSESQLGRKLVATVTADVYDRTEGRRV